MRPGLIEEIFGDHDNSDSDGEDSGDRIGKDSKNPVVISSDDEDMQHGNRFGHSDNTERFSVFKTFEAAKCGTSTGFFDFAPHWLLASYPAIIKHMRNKYTAVHKFAPFKHEYDAAINAVCDILRMKRGESVVTTFKDYLSYDAVFGPASVSPPRAYPLV